MDTNKTLDLSAEHDPVDAIMSLYRQGKLPPEVADVLMISIDAHMRHRQGDYPATHTLVELCRSHVLSGIRINYTGTTFEMDLMVYTPPDTERPIFVLVPRYPEGTLKNLNGV